MPFRTFLFGILLFVHSLPATASTYQRTADGVMLILDSMTVRLYVCSEQTIRVTVTPEPSTVFQPSLVITRQWEPVRWKLTVQPERLVLSTGRVTARIDRRTGAVSFYDRQDTNLLREAGARAHALVPAIVSGEHVCHITQRFQLQPDEGMYGLGQFEYGIMNYRNHHITLIQNNRHVCVPLIVSSRGYGIYWDNYSHTEFDDSPEGMSLWSEVADGIDYYFIAGKNIDDVITAFREASGPAPMFPRWAFGYWQSKERYENQDELMSVVREYRRRQLPIDNIVQDWHYWGKHGWNAMRFDSTYYPDPKGMIDSLHRLYNMQIMVSIWPQVDSNTAVYRDLARGGYLYPTEIWNGGKTYDAYSPEARQIYWEHLNQGLYSLGVDAWWVDATEPDWKWCDSLLEEKQGILLNGKTAIGPSSRYLNTYALMTTEGIYKNQRKTNPDRRVVMLTRSAFAGQQRNATAIWSGDISSNWPTFRNQIAGGVNFSMAGMPYWNSDIGGFLPREYGGEFTKGSRDPAYRELYVRWFQFGAFCPIFRAHGTDFPREIWQFGEPGDWAYDALVKYDKLRYRLLPYIYSTAWQVTSHGSTMMRGLPMDFPSDRRVRDRNTEYMFGPAFLVAPVVTPLYYRRQEGAVIPAQFFQTTDRHPGLKGDYFTGMKFDTLRYSQSDSVIDFKWTESGAPGVGKDHYSLRWTGKLRAPETGHYEFEAISDDGVNLFLAGKQLMDEMYPAGLQRSFGEIDLVKDSLYEFTFEYYQEKEGAQVTLTWRTPSMLAGYRPVTEIQSVPVYLPQGVSWYDFWSGERYDGGKEVMFPAPIDIMPLFVPAGTILPLGPVMESSTQRPLDTLDVRLYPGADGKFTLYEDENDSYRYEKGVYAEIPFTWNEKAQTLTIGKRRGSFPGMRVSRVFRVVAVRKNVGVGIEEAKTADAVVRYVGQATRVTLGEQ